MQVGAADAERFCKAFIKIHKKLVGVTPVNITASVFRKQILTDLCVWNGFRLMKSWVWVLQGALWTNQRNSLRYRNNLLGSLCSSPPCEPNIFRVKKEGEFDRNSDSKFLTFLNILKLDWLHFLIQTENSFVFKICCFSKI